MEFKQTAINIRELTLKSIASIGQGHIGGSYSIVDCLTVLYFKKMNIDPNNPKLEGRDRLVVSKGHAGPAVYATLAERGYFPKSELLTLNKLNTNLPSHCDMNKTPGIDMTTGSLGQGLSCAVGMALASRIKNDGATIYCIIGDGESQEGQIWEASMYASQQKLNNLIVFLDNNKMQIDDYTDKENSLLDPVKKWESFGFFVLSIDGHNFDAIDNAIDCCKEQSEKPSLIVLNTIKGKGLKFVEAQGLGCHSMPITDEQLDSGIKELEESR